MSWRDIIKDDITCISCGEKYTLSEMQGNECKYCIANDSFSLEEMKKENKKPMDRVSTTASKLPQDEEAAERTKKNEADLLAEIMARNKKVKETLRGENNE